MFEFYMVKTDPDTNQEEIKKCQYEETDENLCLKQQLENELSLYEYSYMAIEDRYYHYRYDGPYTAPIKLSHAVFQNNRFIGCFINGKLRTIGESSFFVSKVWEKVDVEIEIRKKTE